MSGGGIYDSVIRTDLNRVGRGENTLSDEDVNTQVFGKPGG